MGRRFWGWEARRPQLSRVALCVPVESTLPEPVCRKRYVLQGQGQNPVSYMHFEIPNYISGVKCEREHSTCSSAAMRRVQLAIYGALSCRLCKSWRSLLPFRMGEPETIPRVKSCRALARVAEHCTRCPLYKKATQTVFGQGQQDASIVIVGEQPGDQEDIEGHPFVGPAGKLLNSCLEKAGIDRHGLYVTNAVKHFKWEPVGKRRLHKKPSPREIAACKPWLEVELALIKPKLIVALGATAAQCLMGANFKVTLERGKFHSVSFGEKFMATVHPSSLLRFRGPDREAEIEKFVTDLKKLRPYL